MKSTYQNSAMHQAGAILVFNKTQPPKRYYNVQWKWERTVPNKTNTIKYANKIIILIQCKYHYKYTSSLFNILKSLLL